MTRRLELNEAERTTLEPAVRHHPKPYVRERAAGLLKIAARASAAWVAEHGLLARHAPDTVYRWLDRYEREGLAALTIRSGRGRKPRLPPLGAGPREEQRIGLLELLASDPRDHGQARSRWTLAGLQAAVPEFAAASRSGIWRVLRGHRLGWKRVRDHLHRPDPAYQEKLAHLATIRPPVAEQPVGAVLRYLDEVTYYRQPALAAACAPIGSADPRAERSTRSTTPTRVIGALDAHTGRVTCLQQTRIGVPALIRFYRDLVAAYPGQRLSGVLDHWPVHFHPDVLAALEPQRSPIPFFRPRSWSAEPRPNAQRLNLPIQLVPLPTSSPWLNYIEKLWRWLKQDVLHLHRLADHLDNLRAPVITFLSTFAQRSETRRRYGPASATSGFENDHPNFSNAIKPRLYSWRRAATQNVIVLSQRDNGL